jgi:hypothetical protein
MMSELKPCPFCNDEGDPRHTEIEGYHCVQCWYCGCMGELSRTKEGAIKYWNHRPVEDALTAQLADIRRIFDGLSDQPSNEAIIHAMSEIKSVVYDDAG